ncbi:hypothetical protein BTR23_11925 [Alkalihalophilus pseudofirmus]|nr:hypothetical protein BTR23_11925 [Alkalihalophilus pseudofirmus]
MIINNNIPALNTYRQMGANQAAGQSAMEKLASGLRINKAGDDAAGLAISEKMRAQVRGLDQASRNAQDGISMIQTAEGALNETHSILQRMRELATQAANDTNTDTDRNEIQKEMNQLTSEINRIGNTTEFNTQKLLDGGKAGSAEVSGATLTGGRDADLTGAAEVYTIDVTGKLLAGNTISFNIEGVANYSATVNQNGDATTASSINHADIDGASEADMTAQLVASINQHFIDTGVQGTWVASESGGNVVITHQDTTQAPTGVISNFNQTGDNIDNTLGYDAGSAAVTANAASGTISFSSNLLSGGTEIQINDHTYSLYDSSKGEVASTALNTTGVDISGFTSNEEIIDFLVANDNVTGATLSKTATNELTVTADSQDAASNAFVLDVRGPEGQTNNFTADFQIGANKGQSMSISIADMRSTALGISSLAGTSNSVSIDGKQYDVAWANKDVSNGTDNVKSESALSVATHADAAKSIEVINAAIEKVSAERSQLGAFQNRLDHTINNLGTSAENLQAAESRIRDVDMAREVMEMTKNNILSQASQAMLAQANQAPQAVLQLLG